LHEKVPRQVINIMLLILYVIVVIFNPNVHNYRL
jgi:hypothetical protein